MSEPAEPGSMLSALQNRLLVWRGCKRARARAGSPVTIRPPSMRAKPGSSAITPDSLATANPESLISMAMAPMVLATLDIDWERDGGVGLQLRARVDGVLYVFARRRRRRFFLLGRRLRPRRARSRRARRRRCARWRRARGRRTWLLRNGTCQPAGNESCGRCHSQPTHERGSLFTHVLTANSA